jgi:hypothetical protein
MKFEQEIRGHIDTINKEMGEIERKMGEIKTDVGWLKKFFWTVAISSIGALITELISLTLKK